MLASHVRPTARGHVRRPVVFVSQCMGTLQDPLVFGGALTAISLHFSQGSQLGVVGAHFVESVMAVVMLDLGCWICTRSHWVIV